MSPVDQPGATDLAEAQMPERIGGFKLLAPLGAGTMGRVFKALQVSMDRVVALKVIPPELAKNPFFTQRFIAEARVAGRLIHPHVVSCYDVGQADGYMYMALEYVGGGDVAQLAKRTGGKLAERRALEIVRDSAAGLEAIHAAGLIHRDIKPANIFLNEQGSAKLGDLGLARGVGDDDGAIKHGGTVGTPSYISPEQAGGAEVDIRTDIYSLCASLYRLVTGQAPFSGDSPWAVVEKVINGTVPDPRTIAPAISARTAAIIRMGTAKDVAQRYASPTELRTDIELVLGGRDPAHAMPQPKPPLRVGAAVHRAGKTGQEPIHGSASRPVQRAPERRAGVPARISGMRMLAIAAGAILAITVIALIVTASVTMRRKVEQKQARINDVVAANLAAAPIRPPGRSPPAKPPAPRTSAPAGPDPALERAARELMALPPGAQIQHVVEELRKLNSDYDGRIDYVAAEGQIVELTLSTLKVSRIAPLAQLRNLRTLKCRGERQDLKGSLDNLAPLTWLPLSTLDVSNNCIIDLAPLVKVPLEHLDCRNNLIRTLAPIHDMRLRRLEAGGNFITDLGPLRGMPLTALGLSYTKVTDLAPLAALGLKELDISHTRVSQLSPLKDMAVERLVLIDTQVSDLSPVASRSLHTLLLTPERMSNDSMDRIRALDSLRWIDSEAGSMPSSAAEFWQRVSDGEFTERVRGDSPIAPGASGNVLANGDFETLVGRRQLGWNLDASCSIQTGTGSRFLRVIAPGVGEPVGAVRELGLDPAWTSLSIDVRMRAKGMTPEANSRQVAQLLYYFMDERGNRVGRWPNAPQLHADADWTRLESQSPIPPGAKRIWIGCQSQCIGATIDFDDVMVRPR